MDPPGSYLATRNALAEDIIRAFRQHTIELPYPYRALTTGSLTAPFPVRLVPPGGSKNRPEPPP